MPTTLEAIDALCARIGFDKPRAKAVARALTDAGRLPAGGPGKSPELDAEHVVDIVIGCSVDAPLRAIADSVAAYRAMTPGGANLDGAPASIDTAGRALDIWADIAIHGDAALLRREQIEMISNWPEIAIHSTGSASRFREIGALASHWAETGHRKSTTINGAALVDALRELFTEIK
ncbi:hypothetical protein ASD64_14660 [Mesorhizobium sp. Root157]|uniref:hypothetical protein n=1 Tax=Mesorhizobium sp. Root157 TaxID=1736477 RepID=UPI0006FB4FB8|nr:hypothetical protein [Mesorhizobium sp. Root157]KQZ99570.1 hypothetical protein ASD64_14660 [Mesorhizobium sp. Root157]